MGGQLGIGMFVFMILISILIGVFSAIKKQRITGYLFMSLILLGIITIVIGSFVIKEGIEMPYYSYNKKDISSLVLGSVMISGPLFLFVNGLIGLLISTLGYVRKSYFRKEMKEIIKKENKENN